MGILQTLLHLIIKPPNQDTDIPFLYGLVKGAAPGRELTREADSVCPGLVNPGLHSLPCGALSHVCDNIQSAGGSWRGQAVISDGQIATQC